MKALRLILGTLALYFGVGPLASLKNDFSYTSRFFHKHDAANLDPRIIGASALAIIVVLLLGTIGLRLAAALLPSWAGASKSLAENYSTVDWGDPTANDISPIFSMVTALLAMLGFFGVVVGVLYLRHGRGSYA